MKLAAGSDVDTQFCMAIKHEFYRCRDAYMEFGALIGLLSKSEHSRQLSYRAYNAYSSFILHLYELLLAVQARDAGDTNIVKLNNKKKVERTIDGKKEEIQKHKALDLLMTLLTERAIKQELDGTPSLNKRATLNALLPVPHTFAEEFRTMRNKVAGHVTYERIREIDLSSFYEKYNRYLYLLYSVVGTHWGRRTSEFPDFEEVTNFLSTITASPPADPD